MGPCWRDEWEVELVGNEDRVDIALETGKYICAEVLTSVSNFFDIFLADQHTLTGQTKYLYLMSTLVKPKPNRMVKIQAPRKPSTVFFGLSLIS